MRNIEKIVTFIPARAGSKRVKLKNLRLLGGHPLISYSILNAKKCFNYKDIFVNSDSDEILKIGLELGVSTYKRDKLLANDQASGDEFAYDFMKNIDACTCVMLNPVCPFLSFEDINLALNAYKKSNCDTLISCEETQMQAFCQDQPVNIDINSTLVPTQNNPIVKILNWAITIWDVEAFIKRYEVNGFAYIGHNRLLFSIDKLKGLKISTEKDFKFAESIIQSNLNKDNDHKV